VSSPALVLAPRAGPARRRWPRTAVTAVFVAHGLLFASWTAHIPHVMRHLGLTDGTLGIALLGAPAGSVTAMLLASYLIPRLGSRRVVPAALVGYCVDRSPGLADLSPAGPRPPAGADRVRGGGRLPVPRAAFRSARTGISRQIG
jgi:hypothetical protein